jgi:hypothetical protein
MSRGGWEGNSCFDFEKIASSRGPVSSHGREDATVYSVSDVSDQRGVGRGEDGLFRDVMSMSRPERSEWAVLAGVDDRAELGKATEVKFEEPPEVGGGRVVDSAVDVGGRLRGGVGRVGSPGGGHDGIGGMGGGCVRGDGPIARGRIDLGVGGPGRQGAGLRGARPGPCGGPGHVGGEQFLAERKAFGQRDRLRGVGTSSEPR